MTSVNSWYPEPVEMDGPGLEWGPVQWAKVGTFSDDEHPQLGDNERRFYTIAIRRGWSEETDAASIAVLGVTRDLESGVETRYRADSENWTPVDRDGIPPSVCKRPPRDSNIPVARKAKFRSVLERAHDRGNNPVDTRSDSASELRADGGTRESEQVDRAVREAATLIDAGDSKRVAISYVVNEYELEHRRDDIHQRVRDRLEHKVVADGGRDAFLRGECHYCDVCSTPFETLGELIRHDCQDQQLVADGGRPEHHASCDDCSWTYRDTDLVDVSDEMERHARKEMHDVDLERAVATDGGNAVGSTERLKQEQGVTTEYQVMLTLERGSKHIWAGRRMTYCSPAPTSEEEAVELTRQKHDGEIEEIRGVETQEVPAPEKWPDDDPRRRYVDTDTKRDGGV